MGLGEKERKVLHACVAWNARNEKKNCGKEVKAEELIGDIKSLGFL